MENIVFTIFPIWEILLIGGLLDHWFFFIISSSDAFLLWFDLEILISIHARRAHFHLMRINNFSLLFQIKGLSLFEDNGILQLISEVLLVARDQTLGVRVPYKLICASGFPSSLVPSN